METIKLGTPQNVENSVRNISKMISGRTPTKSGTPEMIRITMEFCQKANSTLSGKKGAVQI